MVFISQERYNELTNIELKYNILKEENKKLKEDNNKINRKMNTLTSLMEVMEKQQQEWADYCEKLKQENNELELKMDELDKSNEDNFNEKELLKDIVNDLKEENEELKEFKENCEETCSADATVQSIMNKLEKAKNQVYEKEQAIRKYAKNKRINNHKIIGFDALYNNYNNVIEALNMNYNDDDDEEYYIDNDDIISEIDELKTYKTDAERLMDALGAEDIDEALDMID